MSLFPRMVLGVGAQLTWENSGFYPTVKLTCEQVMVVGGQGWWGRGSGLCCLFVSSFEQTFLAASLPRDDPKDVGSVPGEDKRNKSQSMEGKAAPSSFP